MRVGPMPTPVAAAPGDRVRRGDEGIRPVVEVEQRPLGALEEHALAVAERPVDEERRVRDVRPQPRGELLHPVGELLDASSGSTPWMRSSRTFFSASAVSNFWRRIFGSRRSWTRMPMPRGLVRVGGPIPRRVVPIWRRPSRRSLAESMATCHGMIRCALPRRARPRSDDPRSSSSSSSSRGGPGRRRSRRRRRRSCPGRGSRTGRGGA